MISGAGGAAWFRVGMQLVWCVAAAPIPQVFGSRVWVGMVSSEQLKWVLPQLTTGAVA